MNLASRISDSFSGSLIFCILVLFSSWAIAQQDDSLNLQLFGYDDLNLGAERNKRSISSTNRLAESPDDMSQQVIIIDGDEIRKFGYATLVDVLKSIPGFRTSQPGNTFEGELFLMRGLVGNDHAKILINGIPIKPEAVRGMPIASQLPIKHAERIEIVLGPSSSSYGTDAMAGVINIVLPEIDRPVFAWADVNLLSPRTTDFNLTLGGKVGKGKNILNYEIFASSSKSADLNIYLPDDSIRAQPGELTWSHQQLFFGGDGVPEVDDIRRESRLMGTYLKFRWFEVSAMNMYRDEHSGIGSHPLTQSHHDPGLSFGENINSFSFKYNDIKQKRYMSKFALSALTYRTLKNSAYYGVSNFLSNGKNFMYARSVDLLGEYSGILKINERVRFAIGGTVDYSISHPFTSYLSKPYRNESASFDLPDGEEWLENGSVQSVIVDSVSLLDSTQFLRAFSRYNYGGFIHFSYKTKSGKFSCEAGTRIDYNSFNELVFTPKLGLVYKPRPRLKLSAYYGSGYRAPRSYYIYNNYVEQFQKVLNGSGLKREEAHIDGERLGGGELNMEWKATDHLKFKVGYYLHYMTNKVLRQIYDTIPGGTVDPTKERVGVGFFNEDSYSILSSLMLTAEYQRTFRKVELGAQVSYEYAGGVEIVGEADSAQAANIKTAGYRFVPEHSFKANLTVSAYDFTLSFRNSMIKNFVTGIYRVNRKIEAQGTDKLFYNLDILLHKQLFRQLSVFAGAYNVLNSVQTGISNNAVDSFWSFNPQYGRYFKFGLSFKLN